VKKLNRRELSCVPFSFPLMDHAIQVSMFMKSLVEGDDLIPEAHLDPQVDALRNRMYVTLTVLARRKKEFRSCVIDR